ncbi:Alpha/beta hydrolase fold-1 [Dactylonectria macrodidyma]|uniref:Alpha/beta hydrolase fold-1 n=1 Tax=Dactylonectria macrodidyma TaxID=307937 RepID=A0A9P9ENA8_9HYPO|nr:Alpha/beta hydrolase fold-1 [Dactylonectria macrodidyma]
MSKPTIVLVPGAWHTPTHYEMMLQRFRDAGYPTSSKQLPSVGSSDPQNQSVTADMNFIRQDLLLHELDQGRDVILILHSYGGSPGGAAAKGLSKAERASSGKKGGIIGLVYMCAFVANEGDSLLSKFPGQKWEPWHLVNEETFQIDARTPWDIFYNGVDDSLASPAIQAIKQQAIPSFTSPSPPPAWKDDVFNGRRAYIKCHQDRAIIYIAQSMMISLSSLEWHELDLEDASHSPFLTHVDPIFNFVHELATEWKN